MRSIDLPAAAARANAYAPAQQRPLRHSTSSQAFSHARPRTTRIVWTECSLAMYPSAAPVPVITLGSPRFCTALHAQSNSSTALLRRSHAPVLPRPPLSAHLAAAIRGSIRLLHVFFQPDVSVHARPKAYAGNLLPVASSSCVRPVVCPLAHPSCQSRAESLQACTSRPASRDKLRRRSRSRSQRPLDDAVRRWAPSCAGPREGGRGTARSDRLTTCMRPPSAMLRAGESASRPRPRHAL